VLFVAGGAARLVRQAGAVGALPELGGRLSGERLADHIDAHS